MNLQETQFKHRSSRILVLLCSLVMTVSLTSLMNAQDEPKTKAQPTDPGLTDPLTDPSAQTQTGAMPLTQQPTGNRGVPQQDKQIVRPVNPNAKKKVEIPKPEDLILDTTDGVRLKCTYFPPPKPEAPTEPGAEAEPVLPFILLHDWEGDRRQLLAYASFLQHSGHAAIVPDLRGHGESTEVIGVSNPIDYKKFRKSDVMSAQKDVERCKKFLVQEHNKGELNIDLLCMVAVGETSVIAVQWALNDWFAFPPKNPKGIKQGQDIKALMLVSPVRKLAGVSMMKNLQHPLFSGANGPAMPMLVTWGASEETADESEEIAEMLEKDRPDTSGITDPAERMQMTSFFSVPIRNYKFSGVEMMESNRVEKYWPFISNRLFVQKVIANAHLFPWVTREEVLDEADK